MRKHAKSLCKVLDREIGRESVLWGVEVGVWKGELSRDLLTFFPRLFLRMVDLWEPAEDSSMHSKDNTKPAMCEAILAAMTNTSEFENRRALMQMGSTEAADALSATNSDQDFVFVDADHFYESVKADVEVWWPKVREGGVLAGHDYGGQGDRRKGWGVRRAVDEFFGRLGVVVNVEPGLVWWVKKV